MKSNTGADLRSLERSQKGAMRKGINLGRKLLFVGSIAMALVMTTEAFAKGGVAAPAGNVGGVNGTAKPPAKGGVSAFPVTPLPIPAKALADACVGITGCKVGTGLNGFDVTGFMQDATVLTTNATCPNTPVAAAGQPDLLGGTVTVNNVVITIPCNTIVQMPANTFTWADFINSAKLTPEWNVATNTIKGYRTVTASPSPMQYEVHVIGNTVGTKNIAALVYVSQQSVNRGSGIITAIDYSTGKISVADGLGGTIILQINDPAGTFGLAHSPDDRFSVDNQNPTVHSGSGYPMCVPRTDPAVGDDPLCPIVNRPKVAVSGCRNFTASGLLVLPKSGELPAPLAADVYCMSFVMPPVTVSLSIPGVVNAKPARAVGEPDARQQAPIEVGDFVGWSGTLFNDGTGTDYVSVHTLEDNVGIFTQPGTQPAYIAMGDFGLGLVDPPPAPAAGLPVNFNGVFAEITNRFFLEAATTDVVTPVDIYYMDVNNPGGAPYHADSTPRNRWVTPFNMTGECDPAPAVIPVGGVLGGSCLGVEGGIRTQFTGPQNMRARIRAIKPPTDLLNRPSRYIRVVQRSLCKPSQALPAVGLAQTDAFGDQIIDTSAQDKCIADAYAAVSKDPANHANGLVNGTYLAPVFEFVFPENTQAGQPIVPNDFWDLPFLAHGEGVPGAGGVGPLEPAPW